MVDALAPVDDQHHSMGAGQFVAQRPKVRKLQRQYGVRVFLSGHLVLTHK